MPDVIKQLQYIDMHASIACQPTRLKPATNAPPVSIVRAYVGSPVHLGDSISWRLESPEPKCLASHTMHPKQRDG